MSMSSPTARRWAELVTELERSESSLREFARRRRANASTLAWWRWRLRQAAELEFVEVPVAAVTEPTPIRVRIDDRPLVIEVVDGASLELVRRLVEALC